MDDSLPIANFLNLDSHSSLARWTTSNNITDDIELATARWCEREPFARIAEQSLSRLQRRVWVPVVRLFRSANDGTALERAGNAKGPGAVRVLTGERHRARVADEASLAWYARLAQN